MRSKKILVILAVVVFGSWLGQQQAWAQKEKPYPTRQISYLICFDPGGQSDRVARLQQPHLDRILGQKVIIDYKVGGGGDGRCPHLLDIPPAFLVYSHHCIEVPNIRIGFEYL